MKRDMHQPMSDRVPEALDRRTRAALSQTLELAGRRPRLFALLPAARLMLALGLSAFSIFQLIMLYSVFASVYR